MPRQIYLYGWLGLLGSLLGAPVHAEFSTRFMPGGRSDIMTSGTSFSLGGSGIEIRSAGTSLPASISSDASGNPTANFSLSNIINGLTGAGSVGNSPNSGIRIFRTPATPPAFTDEASFFKGVGNSNQTSPRTRKMNSGDDGSVVRIRGNSR